MKRISIIKCHRFIVLCIWSRTWRTCWIMTTQVNMCARILRFTAAIALSTYFSQWYHRYSNVSTDVWHCLWIQAHSLLRFEIPLRLSKLQACIHMSRMSTDMSVILAASPVNISISPYHYAWFVCMKVSEHVDVCELLAHHSRFSIHIIYFFPDLEPPPSF